MVQDYKTNVSRLALIRDELMEVQKDILEQSPAMEALRVKVTKQLENGLRTGEISPAEGIAAFVILLRSEAYISKTKSELQKRLDAFIRIASTKKLTVTTPVASSQILP